jgi:hypothetical protein
MMSIGFSDDGCVRCCALHKTSCSSDHDSFSDSNITAWAIAAIIAVGVCFVFTLLYIVTGKKRNDGIVFRAFTSHSYYVALPIAVRADDDTACSEEKGEEAALSDSVFLLKKDLDSADVTVPVARRTVPPVVAVRRPQTLQQAQANMFYLDTQAASEGTARAGGSSR